MPPSLPAAPNPPPEGVARGNEGGVVPSVVPIVAASKDEDAAAAVWAERLGAPLLARADWAAGSGGRVVVWVDAVGLALRGPAAARAAPVRPSPPPVGGRAGRELLLRAVGVWDDVTDATAGWAADAGVLAAAGRHVRLIERHPVLAAILADALNRWRGEGRPGADRLALVAGDARHLLGAASTDVIVLDPMYPARGKAARKGEGLHLARALVGGDPDQDGLLRAARTAARRRVVVKRPRAAPPMAGATPSGSIVGRTTRYDLYAPLVDPRWDLHDTAPTEAESCDTAPTIFGPPLEAPS